jgi:hypothetical protein
MSDRDEIVIVVPLTLFDSRHPYVHRGSSSGGWCFSYGSRGNQRTGSSGVATHMEITETEIEKNIVIARKERNDAEQRLEDLEKLQYVLVAQRRKNKVASEKEEQYAENLRDIENIINGYGFDDTHDSDDIISTLYEDDVIDDQDEHHYYVAEEAAVLFIERNRV